MKPRRLHSATILSIVTTSVIVAGSYWTVDRAERDGAPGRPSYRLPPVQTVSASAPGTKGLTNDF